MTVIGWKDSPQTRLRKWNDLRESKAVVRKFRFSSDEQEQRMCAVDQDFYSRKLMEYVA